MENRLFIDWLLFTDVSMSGKARETATAATGHACRHDTGTKSKVLALVGEYWGGLNLLYI